MKDILFANKQLLFALIGLAFVFGFIIYSGGDLSSLMGTGSINNPIVDNGNHAKYERPPAYELAQSVDYQLRFSTSRGTFTVDLYEDYSPRAVANMLALVTDDYYDDSSFFRVVPGFLIQGGDPMGTGSGGPGYTLGEDWSSQVRFAPYVLVMDLSVNGSQFFILSGEYVDDGELDEKYTAVGIVISGESVIDTIEDVALGATVDGIEYKEMPKQSVKIRDIRVIEK